MLCHPFEIERTPSVGFKWREGSTGAVPALAVDEFLIASHLAPGIYDNSSGATVADVGGTLLPRTLTGLFARLGRELCLLERVRGRVAA